MFALDERRQDQSGDNEADYLHDDEHWHRLACDARERFAETTGDRHGGIGQRSR